MKTELYKAIKTIDAKNLSDDDLEDLLVIFMATKNALIRNQISFIFGDSHYDKAIPYILRKLNEKSVLHNNGSLVYSLGSFDMKNHFIDLLKIIYLHEYEPRLMAFEIVHKIAPSINSDTKNKAMEVLEGYKQELERNATDKGENSSLNFIEKTIELLQAPA